MNSNDKISVSYNYNSETIIFAKKGITFLLSTYTKVLFPLGKIFMT